MPTSDIPDIIHLNRLNDVFFKALLGSEERKTLTLNFINAILNREGSNAFTSVTFSDKEIVPPQIDGKRSFLDVLVEMNDGTRVHVEVQVLLDEYMANRSLYYWGRIYSRELEKGDVYANLRPVITINLLDFDQFPQYQTYINTYHITNDVTHHMQIFVDADACPVIRQIERIARKYKVPVTLLCDTNHVLTSDYSTVKTIGASADAVDFALINLCHAGDVVVTQDFGVAAMALGRHAYAVHQDGWQYTDENIDRLLMERHLAKKTRRASKKNHLKGAHKRTAEDDEIFCRKFERLLQHLVDPQEFQNQ